MVPGTATARSESVEGGVGGAGGPAVAGSGAVNVMANIVHAYVNAATVTANDNVLVLAKTDAAIFTYAGTIDGSLAVGVGGSAAVNVMNNDTEAFIQGGAHVTALGNGNA